MRFTWDPAKSEANLLYRGFDFDFASLIFDGPTVEAEDRRRDYRERRMVAIAWPTAYISPSFIPTGLWRTVPNGGSFQPEGASGVSVKSTKRSLSTSREPSRGRADLERLRRTPDAEVARTSPPELADLPPDFWAEAVVVPGPKKAISLRVDQDVLEWFRETGPRYQTRMNAVLRTYVTKMRQDQKRLGTTRHTKRSNQRLQRSAAAERADRRG